MMTGPYVVTVKRPSHVNLTGPEPYRYEVVSRVAVATLEEAAGAAMDAVADAWQGAGAPECPADQTHDVWDVAGDDARILPEEGGTVGPLPDGTVIEVERVQPWSGTASAANWCAIYNSKHAQEARA